MTSVHVQFGNDIRVFITNGESRVLHGNIFVYVTHEIVIHEPNTTNAREDHITLPDNTSVSANDIILHSEMS